MYTINLPQGLGARFRARGLLHTSSALHQEIVLALRSTVAGDKVPL